MDSGIDEGHNDFRERRDVEYSLIISSATTLFSALKSATSEALHMFFLSTTIYQVTSRQDKSDISSVNIHEELRKLKKNNAEVKL